MTLKYDLDELLADPGKPLTEDQYNNFGEYMRFSNDDRSASGVNISGAVDNIIRQMDKKGLCWW